MDEDAEQAEAEEQLATMLAMVAFLPPEDRVTVVGARDRALAIVREGDLQSVGVSIAMAMMALGVAK